MKVEDIDQNYDDYRMFSEHIGLRPVRSRRVFLGIKRATSHVETRRGRVDDWTGARESRFRVDYRVLLRHIRRP